MMPDATLAALAYRNRERAQYLKFAVVRALDTHDSGRVRLNSLQETLEVIWSPRHVRRLLGADSRCYNIEAENLRMRGVTAIVESRQVSFSAAPRLVRFLSVGSINGTAATLLSCLLCSPGQTSSFEMTTPVPRNCTRRIQPGHKRNTSFSIASSRSRVSSAWDAAR